MNQSGKNQDLFIPARESAWFISLFDLYVRNLFWRRFKNVWLAQEYHPGSENKTIYYLNHTSWWDGLIPLLLNQKVFHQKARAMMEDRQMKAFPFFKKIGAFSVPLDQPKGVLTALRYAVDSMQRPASSLFIFPEGKIVPFSVEKPTFKKGLSWIASKCPETDVVPIAIYISCARSDKPELFIKVGNPVPFTGNDDTDSLNHQFETGLQNLLASVQEEAFSETTPFNRLI